MADFPHLHLVPKEFTANVKWRREVLLQAAEDAVFAASIRQMCAEDCLFYVNGFAWTYDPRDTKVPKKPFITYTEFQDDAIAEMIDSIEGGYDIACPKSRTMGASWMGLSVFEWMWHFRHDLSFLLISRNEDYVDKKGNPKALFWKIDFLHENQPKWLLPNDRWLGDRDPNRKGLHLANADTKSVMDGESTTGDAGRGDRRTAMFMDELAAFELNDGFKVLKSSRDTTKCRIFNSTPQGANNAFFEVCHNSGARVIRMHWSSHPLYNQGLYTAERGPNGIMVPKLLDDFKGFVKTQRKEWEEPKEFLYPDDYPFMLDGKQRSPWYDGECSRCVSEQEVAQELDIDFLGSDYQFFDAEFIDMLMNEYCTEPVLIGRLLYQPDSCDPQGFEIDPKGPLQLWFNLPGAGPVLRSRDYFQGRHFGLGSDVSFGTGASNSATSVVDLATGRKVALWKDPHTDPQKFCRETVALAKWFNNGFMIWDSSGPSGKTFTQELLETKYRKIYYRRNEESAKKKVSDQPGYFLNSEARAVLLQDYRHKLGAREFINPSRAGMRECLQFIVQPGGKVEHSASANSQDPRGAREAHGDEVVADALASRILTMKPQTVNAKEPEPPYMSPAWRMREAEKEKAASKREDW